MCAYILNLDWLRIEATKYNKCLPVYVYEHVYRSLYKHMNSCNSSTLCHHKSSCVHALHM